VRAVVVIGASRLALAPVLLVQGRRVRRLALRLPEADGPRDGIEGAATGDAPLRLLVVGDSTAAGVGVATQHEAIAQPAAAALAARTGRPVAWQLVARSGVDTRGALELVRRAELAPADVVLVCLGVNDVTAQRVGAAFVTDYAALVLHLQSRTGARHVLVNGVPPMHVLPTLPQPLRWYLGRCAARNDRLLAAWARTRPDLVFLPLDWAARPEALAADGFHPGPSQYARWATLVAEQAAARLAGEAGPAG
jgi:lysophospholipase L1-like esterase